MKFRSKRAVSTVIATILMVNIAIVLGVTAYIYQQDMLGTLTSNYEIFLERGKQRMRERISIVHVRFDNATDMRLNITVLNSGLRHVFIDSIYLNGTDILSGVFRVWNDDGSLQTATSDGEYLLVVSDGLTFSFKIDVPEVNGINYGCKQLLIVATSDGITANGEWTATRGV